jgi:hypothetical protein
MYLNREVHIITCTWNMNNPNYNLIQNGLIPIEQTLRLVYNNWHLWPQVSYYYYLVLPNGHSPMYMFFGANKIKPPSYIL